MKKVGLENIYSYLEAPETFTEEETIAIQQFLISLKEKINQINQKYCTNIQVSEYINSLLEKEYVVVETPH